MGDLISKALGATVNAELQQVLSKDVTQVYIERTALDAMLTTNTPEQKGQLGSDYTPLLAQC